MVVITNRAAFSEELRVHANTEMRPGALARSILEKRDQSLLHGAWQHGATDCDHMVAGLGGQRLADLVADILDVVEIEAAIAVAGGADADQTDVAVMDSGLAVRAHQQPAGAHGLSHELLKARLEHGRVARCHQGHLLRTHVNADRGMTVVRQTRCGDAPDIAEAEDANSHVYLPFAP